MPNSDSFGDFKGWITDTLDTMAEDRVSRALDVSGGDRAMQGLLAEFSLPAFREDLGFKFLALCMLGLEMEDFNHIRATVDAGVLHPRHMILIMNKGAVPFYLTRLPCVDALREQRLDFYHVAANRPGPDGKPFVARGINVSPDQADAATILQTFPGLNAVRLATTPGADPATIDSLVQGLTSKGVVVAIEDHSSSGGNPNTLSGQALANEAD